MDTGLVALVVLATFGTVHERIIELIRRVFRGPPEYTDADAIADGFDRSFFRQPPRKVDGGDAAPGASPGLIRRCLPRRRWRFARKWFDGLTIGPWSILLAVGLAVGTRANALSLFRKAANGSDALFFSEYLAIHGPDRRFWLWSTGMTDADWYRTVLGCILMGLSTALGSRFWHDLSSGLVDLRSKVKELPSKARKMAAPPETPPDGTLTFPRSPE
jgi:hypothetical protein